MKALIVGNRPLNEDINDISEGKIIIAADGGADRLLEHKITPDWVVGDLDSISKTVAARLKHVTVSNINVEKTDLEKAADYAMEIGADEIVIVGWNGGRIDHTLTALSLALNSNIKLIDGEFELSGVANFKTITGKEKTIFSVLAIHEATVSISGARWNLNQEKLSMSGRGIHNEIGPSGEVTIECHHGKLLVIQGKFVLPHD